ncbi:MAG: hypothetical protein K0Q79_3126 [Flavipsychrobacter sp.]|jgi:signal recognition particle receptor subunit beta|nr:hypothetical protein [Flavipsychrobacter sp.]
MSDLDIIKLIEGIVGKKLSVEKGFANWQKCSYATKGNQVTGISLYKIGYEKLKDAYHYLSMLTGLVDLHLVSNKISDLSFLIGFDNLEVLSLDDNLISDIDYISKLQNLSILYLTANKIENIDALVPCTELKVLDVTNNLIKDITVIVKIKNLSELVIYNNPIQNLPSEIRNQGIKAIRKYLIEKQKQGEEKLFEAKIVIVGAGESGKTTLIRKLQNPNHPVPNIEDKRTEGIRVMSYPFHVRTNEDLKEVMAHIWDFGGQELYHTTHQLFLTPDTLYILLNDNRKNDTDFYYWLNIVTLRAGGKCPILMVFNAKDNSPRQIIPGEEIFNAFPNVERSAIDVNFADKNLIGIHKMKDTIEGHFGKLEVLGKPFPTYWVRVREALGRLKDECIKWDEFAAICLQNGIDDLSQMQILAATLHNLGVILYFPDVFGLKDLIILSSQWCIDAIYSALDTDAINKNAGKFNEHMLAEKWLCLGLQVRSCIYYD